MQVRRLELLDAARQVAAEVVLVLEVVEGEVVAVVMQMQSQEEVAAEEAEEEAVVAAAEVVVVVVAPEPKKHQRQRQQLFHFDPPMGAKMPASILEEIAVITLRTDRLQSPLRYGS